MRTSARIPAESRRSASPVSVISICPACASDGAIFEMLTAYSFPARVTEAACPTLSCSIALSGTSALTHFSCETTAPAAMPGVTAAPG